MAFGSELIHPARVTIRLALDLAVFQRQFDRTGDAAETVGVVAFLVGAYYFATGQRFLALLAISRFRGHDVK